MLPETLISLACLIANSGGLDMSSLEAQLTTAEKSQVQQIIADRTCLPAKLEALLTITIGPDGRVSMPTDTCIIHEVLPKRE